MTFTLNKPFETDQAVVEVDAGLRPGAYRFRLVVVNRSGRLSQPAEVVVTVQERVLAPPIVLDARLATPAVPAPGRAVSGRPTPPVASTATPLPPAPAVATPPPTPRRRRRTQRPPTP